MTAIEDGKVVSSLVRTLRGQSCATPPWWLMRQAGRYLPEYRALRTKAANFIEFCLTPSLAAEATLQPIRRFGMDAAILFADILLIPRALGQKVEFGEHGPMLEPIGYGTGHDWLCADDLSMLLPVYETVQHVRQALPSETALIGFAGSPWTVATYMIEGGASRDYPTIKSWAYRDPEDFRRLIAVIVRATAEYLSRQVEAGADAVQLFDSWAGVLPERQFEAWVIEPTRQIVASLKQLHPDVPVIGFPRGAGVLYERYAAETGVDAVSLDTTVPLAFARKRLQSCCAVQGNLDPIALLAGGPALEQAVRELKAGLGSGPFIFNLGHGVLPQTPPEHVAMLARLMRDD